MNYKRIMSVLLIVLCVVTITTGCNKASKEKVISMGKWNENVYTNEYFGLEMTIPEDWTILSQEEIDYINNVGTEVVSENNEELANEMELSEQQTLNLVYAFRYPLSYQGGNYNIICMAENLSLAAGLTVGSGKEYLEILKDTLEQTGLNYTFENIKTEKIGGKDIYSMMLSLSMNGMEVKQKYYATIIDGYALTIIVSYSTEEQLSEINDILDKMKITE